MKKSIIVLICALIVFVPLSALAFHVSGHSSIAVDCPADGCGWDQLVLTLKSAINFALFYLVFPLSTIIFIYAGFIYVFNASNDQKKGDAKKIFMNVVWGIVIAMSAWLLVSFILSAFGVDDSFILLQDVNTASTTAP